MKIHSKNIRLQSEAIFIIIMLCALLNGCALSTTSNNKLPASKINPTPLTPTTQIPTSTTTVAPTVTTMVSTNTPQVVFQQWDDPAIISEVQKTIDQRKTQITSAMKGESFKGKYLFWKWDNASGIDEILSSLPNRFSGEKLYGELISRTILLIYVDTIVIPNPDGDIQALIGYGLIVDDPLDKTTKMVGFLLGLQQNDNFGNIISDIVPKMSNFDDLQKFYSGLVSGPDLKLADIRIPIIMRVDNGQINFAVEETRSSVYEPNGMNSYNPTGPEMGVLLKEAFKSSWYNPAPSPKTEQDFESLCGSQGFESLSKSSPVGLVPTLIMWGSGQ